MWFTHTELRTTALQKLVWKNNNKLESRIIELLFEFFESVEDPEINAVPQDILNMLNKMFKSSYWTINDVRKLLKEIWKLEPQQNSLAYIKYDMDYGGSFFQQNKLGRYLTIKRNFISQKFDEMMR
jgi:hypothetical protein